MKGKRLRVKANELGFEFVGITPAIPSPHAKFFIKWLESGYSGEMEYLHRTAPVRTDPAQLLPNAKSIVMVGLNYAQQPATHIAMYALGDDYHEVMRDKLNQLLDWIKAEYPEIEGRACVDSAPIMERDMAWQAGLGWFGKNTCLINTRHGSYFFLGALLLNIELEYDKPAIGECGSCRKCIDVCPTGALLEPYTLDATRCISYLTIEKRGSIPEELREHMGALVFGCDICQSVCPFNQPRPNAPDRAKPTTENAFKPRPTNSLIDILTMTEEDFRQTFRHSPVKRAKFNGLLRNACIAAGNSGDSKHLPALEHLTTHENPIVSGCAKWAIRTIME